MIDFQLSEHDKATVLWLRLKAHLEDRLAALRVRNDAPQSEQDTAALRGEIRGLKKLLALSDHRPMTGD